jgi:hypothetical protein
VEVAEDVITPPAPVQVRAVQAVAARVGTMQLVLQVELIKEEEEEEEEAQMDLQLLYVQWEVQVDVVQFI